MTESFGRGVQIYRVGGSVRDELLGLPVEDQDFVVVGARAADLLAQGFKPVGKDFPVFLHPESNAEYALARRERKTAPGHRGFEVDFGPEVTLEEDLLRRDLRINAMARADDGSLIDPYGGQSDLAQGVLRHVSPAFVEDPLRVLRVARFAARFPSFHVADDTLVLMRSIVTRGELEHLSAERVWQEWRKGLLAEAPQRMLQVLADCAALPVLLPELSSDAMESLARLPIQAALPQRYALLFWPGGLEPEARSRAWRLPTDVSDMARLCHRYGSELTSTPAVAVEQVLATLNACDAFRRPTRFDTLLQTLSWGQPAAEPAVAVWRGAASAASAVDAGDLAASIGPHADGQAIALALKQARCAKIAAKLNLESRDETR